MLMKKTKCTFLSMYEISHFCILVKGKVHMYMYFSARSITRISVLFYSRSVSGSLVYLCKRSSVLLCPSMRSIPSVLFYLYVNGQVHCSFPPPKVNFKCIFSIHVEDKYTCTFPCACERPIAFHCHCTCTLCNEMEVSRLTFYSAWIVFSPLTGITRENLSPMTCVPFLYICTVYS